MASLIIGVVSQKGGVGKSSLAKLLSVEYARAGLKTLLADMDVSQITSLSWQQKRSRSNVQPLPDAAKYLSVQQALEAAVTHDMLVFDGAPHATRMTLEIAEIAGLLVLPTGNSIEDLEPQVALAHELVEAGIPQERLVFVLARVGDSVLETKEVVDYLRRTKYHLLAASIPERTIFRRMAVEGKTLTETPYDRLNKRCEQVAQQITDLLSRR